MRKMHYAEMALILLITLIISIVLPSYLSGYQEQQLIDNTVIEESSAIWVERTEKLEEKSLLRKFEFLISEDIEYIEYIGMGSGGNLAYDEALNCLEHEMMTLFDMGILLTGEFSGPEGQLYTATSLANPGQSLAVWRFLVFGALNQAYVVTLDDASGKIVNIEVVSLLTNPEAYYGSAYELIMSWWGEYLGVARLELMDYERTEVTVKDILEDLGEMQKTILESYGLTEVMLEELREKDEYVTESENGVVLDIIYDMEDGEETVECTLEWDFAGFRFRAAR